MMRKLLLVVCTTFISLSSFARDYHVQKDIAYRDSGKDAYMDEMCRLDIAFDKEGTDRPVIVWFHGGGLTSGGRQIPEGMKRDGAVVVGVGYRFVSKVELSEVIDDAAAAVAWVFQHIAAYGGDTSNVYLAGASAGGYLVDMLGLDKHWLAKYGIDADDMAAIVPFSGQVITHFAQRRKMGIDELTPYVDEFAPLYHIRPDAPPFLVFSGDRELELYGRYEETAYFVRMMRLKGHQHVYFYEFDGYGHGNMGYPAEPIFLEYIKKHSENFKERS